MNNVKKKDNTKQGEIEFCKGVFSVFKECVQLLTIHLNKTSAKLNNNDKMMHCQDFLNGIFSLSFHNFLLVNN